MNSSASDVSRRVHMLKAAIAIDGPAASGKSTVGRALARELDCAYLDTGLMYRVVTLIALQRGIPLADAAALAEVAGSATFSLDPAGGEHLRVNGLPVGPELHTAEVDRAVSLVAAHHRVRCVLVRVQQLLATEGCIVMVGRDIGTEVLPDAPVKLWVTASAAARAERRVKDHETAGEPVSFDDELARIIARDDHDSARAASPLRQAADAIVIETDNLTPGEAVRRALQCIDARLAS